MSVSTLVLFLTLGEMVSIFCHWGYCLLWLIMYGFYYVEVCSFHACFLESFYHKWVLNLSKAFSAYIELVIWFFSFNLLMWYITLIDLQLLKNPCIPGIKPTWSWCMNFLICCWILFARILLTLHLCLSVILACSFLFVVFGYSEACCLASMFVFLIVFFPSVVDI